MTTQVGSAVARYGAYSRLGAVDHGCGSLDRSAAWDSLGRHSTISGNYLNHRWRDSIGCLRGFKYAHVYYLSESENVMR